MLKNHRFWLILILIISAILGFYHLDRVPSAVYDDEATVGYNAYSILTTGKDEYGRSFPLAFRFFNAYTPPLYVYLVIPLVKLFGLTALSVRTLSVLSTLAGVVIVYAFVSRLGLFKSKITGLLAAFLFAISPWVVFNSRLGYEVTLGYIVFAWAAYLLWTGIRQDRLSLPAIILLSLSTYIAHTERYLVPVFLALVLLVFRRQLFKTSNPKSLIKGAFLVLVTQIPNFYLMTTPSFWIKNTSINSNLPVLLSDFARQLLIYFSPSTLFGPSPDINLQHIIPHQSLFYSWMIIPFLIGLYRLSLKLNTLDGRYLWLLFLTAPVPGAMSGHFISTQRVITLIIPVILITALGIDWALFRIKPLFMTPLIILLSLFSLVMLWRSYFVFFPRQMALAWSYGYSQLADIISRHPQTKYKIDNSRNERAYMLLLFNSQYPPSRFQQQFSASFVADYYSNPPTFSGNYQLDNVTLGPIDWHTDLTPGTVLVGDPLSVSSDQAKDHCLTAVFDIKDPLGQSVLIGWQTPSPLPSPCRP